MSIAFLFPGQGSQHVGMGSELYEKEPAARAVFDQADDQLGYSLSTLCFNGPIEELTDTANQQPALFVTSMAMLIAMKENKAPAPDFAAGHSLGEFSALTACGSLGFNDGLALVRKRGQLMKKAGQEEPGAMAAVLGLETAAVNELCLQAQQAAGRPVQIANDNCPGQVVISGDEKALEAASQMANEAGARKVIRLPISIAAHSPLMKSAAQEFAGIVDETPLEAPVIPIIGNVTAAPLRSVEEIQNDLKLQLTAPVLWTDSMRYLLKHDVDSFYEVGSGAVLHGLLKRIDRGAKRMKWQNPS